MNNEFIEKAIGVVRSPKLGGVEDWFATVSKSRSDYFFATPPSEWLARRRQNRIDDILGAE